ncbi:MAG: hypothetical protein WC736_16285 [Gallionella sp.]|jgi:hypothetical protein
MIPEPWTVPDSVFAFAWEKTSNGLTEVHKRSLFQFFIRLRNESPKAQRLADRFDAGEIDGDTFLEMMG